MSRKVKVLVSVLVAAVLLTVGGATAAMAQGEPALAAEPGTKGYLATGVEPRVGFGQSSGNAGDNMTTGLLARVAEKLGITQEELVSAFKEAQQEMREEAFIRALDKAVEEGLITQEEADEINEWWQQKPEALDQGLFRRARIFQGMRGQQRMASLGQAWQERHVTQEQAGMIKERWENRLGAQDRPVLGARIQQAIRDRQQVAVPRVWKRLRIHEMAD